jgi:hypothetical protein
MKTFTKTIAFLSLIGIFVGCSKSATIAPAVNHNNAVKQLNSAPFSVSSVTPANGIILTAITITGSNFDTVKADNQVKVNGVNAYINSVTPTQIVATVLAGSTTGPVTVTSAGNTATAPTDFKVLHYVFNGGVNQNNNNYIETLAFDKTGTIYGINGYIPNQETHPTIFKYLHQAASIIYRAPLDTTVSGTNGYKYSYSYTLTGLVTDSHGNVLTCLIQHGHTASGGYPVSNAESASILKITPTGSVSVIASSINSGPIGGYILTMCIDANDNVFIIDDGDGTAQNNSIIYKFTPAGTGSTWYTASEQYFGMAVDQYDNLFVAGYIAGGPTIEKIKPDGTDSFITGPSTAYQRVFSNMFFDPTGNLIATNSYDVFVLNQAGHTGSMPLFIPGDGLFMDSFGNIYDLNTTYNVIDKYTPE